ncbi:hypothetical protein CC80DRAFT_546826 [Byssothecium circinans]|uniref:Uncharacterized protein n=1 Tax=Byssothecium circinans TaxID=147558 RepID=A0A6A5U1P1_9PLEO|nr:hypothetical protein CC80DRAFT_546826 [Byssothecium circinans]
MSHSPTLQPNTPNPRPNNPLFLSDAELAPNAGLNIRWMEANPLLSYRIFLIQRLTALEFPVRCSLFDALNATSWPTHLQSMDTASQLLKPWSPWSVDDLRALCMLYRFSLTKEAVSRYFFEGRTANECEERLAALLGELNRKTVPSVHTPVNVQAGTEEERLLSSLSTYGQRQLLTREQQLAFGTPVGKVEGSPLYSNLGSTTSQPDTTPIIPKSSPQTPNSTNPSASSPASTPTPPPTPSSPKPTLTALRNKALLACDNYLTGAQKANLRKALRTNADWPLHLACLENFYAEPAKPGSEWHVQDSKALLRIRRIGERLPFKVMAEQFFPGRTENAARNLFGMMAKREKAAAGGGGGVRK